MRTGIAGGAVISKKSQKIGDVDHAVGVGVRLGDVRALAVVAEHGEEIVDVDHPLGATRISRRGQTEMVSIRGGKRIGLGKRRGKRIACLPGALG